MSADNELAFVDTNVLVYAFEKSGSPKKQRAKRLIDQLIDEDLLRISTQVVQELFVVLTRKGNQRCSSEEALIVTAAARSGAAVLYTEDLNHGQEIFGVRIRNPFAGKAVRVASFHGRHGLRGG